MQARTSVLHEQRVEVATAPAQSTRYVQELAGLTALYDSAINVCVLTRSRDPQLASAVSSALAEQDYLRSIRVRADSPDLSGLDLDGHPESSPLLADLRVWIQVYSDLLGAEEIGLRLCSLYEAMCPRFHVDRVIARMVITYAGAGTEWIDSRDVDRSRLGVKAGGLPDEQSGLLMRPGGILQMPTYAVGLLKGESWPGNQGHGAVHRSPAVPKSGPRRVLLTLDGL